MIRAMRFAVDRERAGAADSFATIGIERDRFFASRRSARSFTMSSISRNDVFGEISRRFVVDELAFRFRVLLSPDFELEIHEVSGISLSREVRDSLR